MRELSKNEIDMVSGGSQAASLAAIAKAVQKAAGTVGARNPSGGSGSASAVAVAARLATAVARLVGGR